MSDEEIRELITAAVDSVPVPWERLTLVLQRILQVTLRKRIEDKNHF